MRVFDKANSIGRPIHSPAIASGNSESSPRLLPDRPWLAVALTRLHPALVTVIRASIAAAPKNFRHLHGTSPQIRSPERLSREQNRHSARVLKYEPSNLKRSCRAADAVGRDSDDRCKDRHWVLG